MVERQLLELERLRRVPRASHSDHDVDRGNAIASGGLRIRHDDGAARPTAARARSRRAAARRRSACRRRSSRRRRRAPAARSGRSDRARLHAEIRRARRPDRADRRGAEHGDDRLRHVRHVAGDAIAGRMPGAREAPPQTVRPRRTARVTSSSRRRPSPLKTIAGASSRRRSRFSAKFRRASGKKRAPGILSRSSTTRSPIVAADAAEIQTSRQNSAGPLDRVAIQIVVGRTSRHCLAVLDLAA